MDTPRAQFRITRGPADALLPRVGLLASLAVGSIISLAPVLGTRALEGPGETAASPAPPHPASGFAVFDLDDDGRVSWEEYRHGMTKLFFDLDLDGDRHLAGAELDAFQRDHVIAADRDRDRRLSETELAAHAALLFHRADRDRDGELTRADSDTPAGDSP